MTDQRGGEGKKKETRERGKTAKAERVIRESTNEPVWTRAAASFIFGY